MSSYKINGVELGIDPTTARWIDRNSYGEDGWGHPMYVAPREFEMRWDLLTPTGSSQLQSFFNAIGSTGTVIVEIPKYAHPEYIFQVYTGCIIHEPRWGTYFAGYYQDCTLFITNIRTE
jgi:hypothetical protein